MKGSQDNKTQMINTQGLPKCQNLTTGNVEKYGFNKSTKSWKSFEDEGTSKYFSQVDAVHLVAESGRCSQNRNSG